jgi:SpoVK/Ycf46/Vps4 family AAA+-type ATPase
MEIDRTVVLFDEIDELVREREDEHDAFGRFLTTSMLPKLAELWEQRKILYFVATNHIKYFDRAITRSQRFDALILVSPPSYHRKMERVEDLLKDLGCKAKLEGELQKRMWEALEQAGKAAASDTGESKREGEMPIDPAQMLAKFVLLRWDQLDELVKAAINDSKITENIMKTALAEVHDRKLLVRAPYIDFVSDLKYPRRDFDKHWVWIAEGFDRPYEPEIVERNGKRWLVVRRSDSPPEQVCGFQLTNSTIDSATYSSIALAKVRRATKKHLSKSRRTSHP